MKELGLYVPVVLKGIEARTGLIPRRIWIEGTGKKKGHFRNQLVRESDVQKLRAENPKMSEKAAIAAAPIAELTPEEIAVIRSPEFLEATHSMEYGRASDTRDMYQRFDALRSQLYGDDEHTVEKAVAIATEEARFQMEQMGGSKGASGKGWYERVGSHVRSALATSFPDLLDDAEWQGFLGILAVTSARKSPKNNMALALEMYAGYKRNGDIQAAIGEAGAVPVVVKKLQALIAKNGNDLQQFGRWLGQENTVSELRKVAKNTPGVGASGVEGLDGGDTVPNSYLLGPKVGKFYENMAGNFAIATLDAWAVRTAARTLNVALRGTETDLTVSERGQIEYMFQRVAENLDIEVADVQAILWYYEKRLWEHLGLTPTQESWDYEQSAENMAAIYAAGGSVAQDPEDD